MTKEICHTAFDPSTLGDPVAMLTEWTPCRLGGASFCTHALREADAVRISFRPTLGAVLFCAAFLVAGCVCLVGARGDFSRGDPGVIPLLFGLLFGGGGAAMLWAAAKPIVFDREQGLHWRGWKSPQPHVAASVELKSIHALQLISEYCGGKTRFYSYELNLVLVDGTRLNVVDHGDLARLRGDAAALARFLNVPLWDPEP